MMNVCEAGRNCGCYVYMGGLPRSNDNYHRRTPVGQWRMYCFMLARTESRIFYSGTKDNACISHLVTRLPALSTLSQVRIINSNPAKISEMKTEGLDVEAGATLEYFRGIAYVICGEIIHSDDRIKDTPSSWKYRGDVSALDHVTFFPPSKYVGFSVLYVCKDIKQRCVSNCHSFVSVHYVVTWNVSLQTPL